MYNILKSRTFYTLLIGFAYNVWQLLEPSVAPQLSAILDVLFTALASYFHVAGVSNAAQSSAALGTPASGQ